MKEILKTKNSKNIKHHRKYIKLKDFNKKLIENIKFQKLIKKQKSQKYTNLTEIFKNLTENIKIKNSIKHETFIEDIQNY